MKSSPHCLQLEKAHAQQQRSSATKKKKKITWEKIFKKKEDDARKIGSKEYLQGILW